MDVRQHRTGGLALTGIQEPEWMSRMAPLQHAAYNAIAEMARAQQAEMQRMDDEIQRLRDQLAERKEHILSILEAWR